MKMRRNTFAIVLITVYMKKKTISFSTALMMVFGLAENATAEELVVVNDAQGGKSVFKLSTRPTISFDNYNIVLTTDETTVMYPLTEYLSFSLIDDNSSAKQTLVRDIQCSRIFCRAPSLLRIA